MKQVKLRVPEGGGPPTVYPGKQFMPFTIKLTLEGRAEFDRLRRVTGLSGSDLVELLVRRYGHRVEGVDVVPAVTAKTQAADAAEARE